jgi:bzd-type benzoyl-CoA reductase N subunit
MKVLQEFINAAQDPVSYAREKNREKKKKLIGYCCTYTPEEIIYAAGAIPVRLFGIKSGIEKADAHLQAYSCSLVRGIMEDALIGNLDFLDGMVFPHTCDTIQRLSDIWRLNIKTTWHNDIMLPVKLDTQSAREYMEDAHAKFRKELGAWMGTEITDDALKQSIAVYNRLRTLLKRLYEIKSANPEALSGRDLYAVVKGSMVMDRKDAADLIEKLVAELEQKTPPAKGNGKRLVISGGICDHPEIYDLIEKTGARVVWDDLCTGSRFFEGLISEEGDPIKAIASRYSSRIICPAKHAALTVRGDNLVGIAKEQKADGVIFILLKFCDPHAFDYPFMKKMLDDAGIPSMLLEVEQELPSAGQLATRFDAFIEML